MELVEAQPFQLLHGVLAPVDGRDLFWWSYWLCCHLVGRMVKWLLERSDVVF